MDAAATTSPIAASSRSKYALNDDRVPAMTAVSNPNNNPPSAATAAIRITCFCMSEGAFVRVYRKYLCVCQRGVVEPDVIQCSHEIVGAVEIVGVGGIGEIICCLGQFIANCQVDS